MSDSMQQYPLFDDDQVVIGEPSWMSPLVVPCERCRRRLRRDRSRRRRHGDTCWRKTAAERALAGQTAVW